nr:NHL domain-containing protein [Tanacetum cinerariifolium]
QYAAICSFSNHKTLARHLLENTFRQEPLRSAWTLYIDFQDREMNGLEMFYDTTVMMSDLFLTYKARFRTQVSVSSAEEAEEASQKETDASLDCVKNAKEKITEKLINFFLYYRYIAPPFISTNMYGHRGKKEAKKMLVETPLVGSLRHPTLLSISEAGITMTIVSDQSLPANSSFLSVTVDNIHKRLLAVIFRHSKPSNSGLATYDLQAPHDRIFLTTLFDTKSSTSTAGANDVAVDF